MHRAHDRHRARDRQHAYKTGARHGITMHRETGSVDDEGYIVFRDRKGNVTRRSAHATMQWRDVLEAIADEKKSTAGPPKWEYVPNGLRCLCLASKSKGKCEGPEYPLWGKGIIDIKNVVKERQWKDEYRPDEIWDHVFNNPEGLRPFVVRRREEGGRVDKLCYHV